MSFNLSPILDKLFQSLPVRPIPKDVLDALVFKAIEEAQSYLSSEIRKAQWELLLRNKIYELAEKEESAMTDNVRYSQYYENLTDSLDIVLTFSEQGACENTAPFTVLEELLETQTIASCSHIFAWIEQRRNRLTVDMVPQKGKALILLRTLNDLLRRLSKTGDNTKFCGRILTFLSAVFPLGERSGVNLRGEYAAQWEMVTYPKSAKDEKMDVDEEPAKPPVESQSNDTVSTEQRQVAESSKGGKPSSSKVTLEKSEEVKEEFYNTFWWLQLPFSRPTHFVQPGTLDTFKAAVNTVMPVIKEATIKERAMMGSKAVVGSLKRKQESTPTGSDDANRMYLFARFLTSPELLDLEIADTHFRRQFLFQLLILLSHLLQFTQAEKAKWATQRNRSLQMDFTLDPADAKWAQETMAKVYEELRQTAPNGRAFAETVQTILERENNWIKWKNDLCSPFDKEPLQESLEKATASVRKRRERAPEYQHKLGSRALSEIWALGYKDPTDLQMPFRPGDVKSFVREIERENARIKMRRTQIEKQLQARARTAAANNPSATVQVQAAATATSSSHETPAPTLAAPAPQRPQPVPAQAPAASPPLHPSLPAKPSTSSLKPPQRPTTPAPTGVPSTSTTPVPSSAQTESKASTPAPAAKAAASPQVPEITDPQIMRNEESKLRISWLALRTAREQYLHLFGKIGTGDVLTLASEIDKEAKEQEAATLAAAAPPSKSDEPQGTDADNNGEPVAKTDTEDSQQHVENAQNQQGATTEDVPMADAEKSAVSA